jgi:hypothetical protein
MHVLHLPPRHLWRSAALAALLTLAFMALLLTTTPQHSTDGSPQVQAPQTRSSCPRAPRPPSCACRIRARSSRLPWRSGCSPHREADEVRETEVRHQWN